MDATKQRFRRAMVDVVTAPHRPEWLVIAQQMLAVDLPALARSCIGERVRFTVRTRFGWTTDHRGVVFGSIGNTVSL